MKTKLAISASALLLALLHNLLPSVRADAATIVFLVLALLPWIAPLVKSLELPGGFKIELRDVQKAAAKVLAESRVVGAEVRLAGEGSASRWGSVKAEGVEGTAAKQTAQHLQEVAARDPNLALVGAGLEIEKRLLGIAAQHGIDSSHQSVGAILQQLQHLGLVPTDVATGLRDLIALRNHAAHGAPVVPSAAAWVLTVLPDILSTLDRLGQAQSPESRK